MLIEGLLNSYVSGESRLSLILTGGVSYPEYCRAVKGNAFPKLARVVWSSPPLTEVKRGFHTQGVSLARLPLVRCALIHNT